MYKTRQSVSARRHWGYTATITRDGTYYLAREGGNRIHKLAAVHNLAYPAGSPVDVSTLEGGMTQVMSGKGTGGSIDVSSSGLTATDLENAYGGMSSDCTSSCYMTDGGYGKIWNKNALAR